MMKTSRGVIIFVVALSCVSAIQQLNSIDDLKRAFSDNLMPMHSITLLHWFASIVDIDNNDVLRLSFNINGDFGSHYYSNYEKLLPSVPSGNQYCSVGNINRPRGDVCPITQDFPEYVLYPYVIEPANTGKNRDRIIVSVQPQSYGVRRVSEVYLTQHFRRQDNRGSGYDPDHTFSVSTSLLRQLRQFSFDDNSPTLEELRNQYNQNIDDNQLNDLMNIWGNQARLGLLYLIVAPQRGNLVGVCRSNRRSARDLLVKSTGGWQNCEIQHIHVQVMTGGSGKAKILWRNVPIDKLGGRVAVALFRNQMDTGESLTFKKIKGSDDSLDTSVALSEGLEVRLHKTDDSWYPKLKEEICRGKEFESPHAVLVTGYLQLQLFPRDGKACFRLYIKTDCDQWKSDFKNSWVALYASADKDTSSYLTNQWQWAVKFEQGLNDGEYVTFEYCTGTKIAPGLQARFVNNRYYYEEKARTPVWL